MLPTRPPPSQSSNIPPSRHRGHTTNQAYSREAPGRRMSLRPRRYLVSPLRFQGAAKIKKEQRPESRSSSTFKDSQGSPFQSPSLEESLRAAFRDGAPMKQSQTSLANEDDPIRTQPATPCTPRIKYSAYSERKFMRQGAYSFNESPLASLTLTRVRVRVPPEASQSQATLVLQARSGFRRLNVGTDVQVAPFHPFKQTMDEYKQFLRLDSYDPELGLGLSAEEFSSIFAQCSDCRNVMTRNSTKYHRCLEQGSEGAPEGQPTDSFSRLDYSDGPGLPMLEFERLFTQCRRCGLYVTQRMKRLHGCR